ncbi:TIGR03084 family metal-binding protein [Pseudosulfitobacter koreensis]|uniref:TIGR03084 family metal-binding protein n=1 Tax=Pseudosulfitobacter koreensis TaxID=2968472 RepID=A0ABT1Z1M2_9RHOB|nr:TIGR03084 family metal-binding protein [Pseudosulfitobacter koreense]MCR8827043.1 TIGR03084 family metal-binding protein [Pseudosulfitobacter koreense]
MQQAEDFRNETDALAAILRPLADAEFDRETLFKGWTIDDVIGHLHLFNVAAAKSLESDAAFAEFFAPIREGMEKGTSLRELQYPWLAGLRGRGLMEEWLRAAHSLADAYAETDPKKRLKWAGPEMSALSSVTARLMETWAHGQEVFDALGKTRTEHDRIRSIAHLGVATYGWTFANRGLDVPQPAPFVRLTGPSGDVWTWNDAQPDNRVEGTAVDFAKVVCQTRNVADTDLTTTGDAAARWMEIAQCFAGPPEDPPSPGARHVAAG